MSDGGLRKLFRDHLPKPDWIWTSVETGGTTSGVPDSFWAHGPTRTCGWLEFKEATGWQVKLRPHQFAFFATYGAAGTRCGLAVRARGLGSGGPGRDALWLLAGASGSYLAAGGLADVPPEHVLGTWRGSPRTWDWGAVGRLLTAS